jgi:serine protease Do
LQGSTDTQIINDFEIPVGGDVIVEVDGKPVADFNDLLVDIAYQRPGQEVTLVLLREGRRRTLTVELAPRPKDFAH